MNARQAVLIAGIFGYGLELRERRGGENDEERMRMRIRITLDLSRQYIRMIDSLNCFGINKLTLDDSIEKDRESSPSL